MKNKNEIRQNVLQQLSVMDQASRKEETDNVSAQFLASAEYQNAATIGITISNFPEFNTHQLIKNMLADRKHVFCPRVMYHRKMDFIQVTSKTNFEKSKYGIWEPEWNLKKLNNQPDLLIVPGIGFACDTHQRVGFGGGYYDRFLAHYNGTTIALLLTPQVFKVTQWNVEMTDFSIEKFFVKKDCN